MAKIFRKKKQTQNLEQVLFEAADKLRKNMDSSEYKHVVLGLVFLKYISDAFEELYQLIQAGEGEYEAGDDPEDRDFYIAKNIFYVPEKARWSYLVAKAKTTTQGEGSIKTIVNNAMDEIEKENPQLKNVLPHEYGKTNLDPVSLAKLIDHIGKIGLGTSEAQSKDLLGRVYEYFLGEFALAEGQKSGQFYTPQGVVRLLVEIIQPFKGRIYDPCCGSGGMFVMSDKFLQAHQGTKRQPLNIFGQESNQTTWRLCRMNLAMRRLNGANVKWNNEGSFTKDELPDLKADYILANPPFNQKEWFDAKLADDARWHYGAPSENNANYAWIQHKLYHLAPKGKAGFVLSIGSLDSSGDTEIRTKLVDKNLIDGIVLLPEKLFYNTSIGACLWFMQKDRTQDKTLFVDMRFLKFVEKRTQRFMSEELMRDVAVIFRLFHGQRGAFTELVRAYFEKSKDLLLEFRENIKDLNGLWVELMEELELSHNTLKAALSKVVFKKEEEKAILDGQLILLEMQIVAFKKQVLSLKEDSEAFFTENTEGVRKTLVKHLDGFKATETDTMNTEQHALTPQLPPLVTALQEYLPIYETIQNQYTAILEGIRADFLINTKIKNAWNAAAIGQSLWGMGDVVNDLKTTAQQIGYFHEHILWLQTQFPKAIYTDVKGLCKAATQEEMAEQSYVLTPTRYVGFVEIDESGEDFTTRIQSLQKTLLTQMQEANALDADIRQSLEQLNLA